MNSSLVPVYDAAGLELAPDDFVLDNKGRVWKLSPTGNSFRRIEIMDGVEWRTRRGEFVAYAPSVMHLRGYHVFKVLFGEISGYPETHRRLSLYNKLWSEHKAAAEAASAAERRAYVQANLGKLLQEKAGH